MKTGDEIAQPRVVLASEGRTRPPTTKGREARHEDRRMRRARHRGESGARARRSSSALVEAGAAKVYAAARDERRVVARGPGSCHSRSTPRSRSRSRRPSRRANDVTLLINNAGELTLVQRADGEPAELDADFRTKVHRNARRHQGVPAGAGARSRRRDDRQRLVAGVARELPGPRRVLGVEGRGLLDDASLAPGAEEEAHRHPRGPSGSHRHRHGQGPPDAEDERRRHREGCCSPESRAARRRSFPTRWHSRWAPSGTRVPRSSSALSRASDTTTRSRGVRAAGLRPRGPLWTTKPPNKGEHHGHAILHHFIHRRPVSQGGVRRDQQRPRMVVGWRSTV